MTEQQTETRRQVARSTLRGLDALIANGSMTRTTVVGVVMDRLKELSDDSEAEPKITPQELLSAMMNGKFRRMEQRDFEAFSGVEYDGYICEDFPSYVVTADIGPTGSGHFNIIKAPNGAAQAVRVWSINVYMDDAFVKLT